MRRPRTYLVRLASVVVAVAAIAMADGGPSTAATANLAWTTNGPYGGFVDALAIDPSDPSMVFAGAQGVYKSSDNGKRWVEVNSTFSPTSLLIDPLDSSIMYGTDGAGHPWRSLDRGGSWSQIDPSLFGSTVFYGLSIAPSRPNIVYASVFGSPGQTLVYRSADEAATWALAGTVPDSAAYAYRPVVVDPNDPNTVYEDSSRIYRSTDGGATWTPDDHGLPTTYMGYAGLAVDPQNSSTLYVAGNDYSNFDDPVGVVFRSTDGGATWASIDDGLPASHGYSYPVIDPSAPSTLFVCTPDAPGMFVSPDGGATWSPTGFTGTCDSTHGPVINPAHDDIVFGVEDDQATGVLKSIDGGASFAPSTLGIHNTLVSSLAIGGTGPYTLYASTAGPGIFKSTDDGLTWQSVTDPGTPNRPSSGATIVAPASSRGTAYTASSGLDKTTDGGKSWSTLDVAPVCFLRDCPMAINPKSMGTVYVVGTASGGLAGVLKSTDGGATWSQRTKGMPRAWMPTAIGISPSSPSTVYVGRLGGMYKTTNGGNSWTRVSTGLPITQFPDYILSLVVDPVHPGTAYAGFGGSGLYKTTNAGASWSAIDTGVTDLNVNSIAIDPADPAIIWAATESSLFESTDSGAEWTPQDDGIENAGPQAVAVDPSGAFVYLGTGTGVYRSTTS